MACTSGAWHHGENTVPIMKSSCGMRVIPIWIMPIVARRSSKKWAFVADWVRFDALVAHGGIYLDTDLELIRPIDELLIGVDCLLARESKRSIATAFIACQAGDLTMQHARSLIADELSKRQMFATSPHILKRAVALAGRNIAGF